jgi:hypothetical protein
MLEKFYPVTQSDGLYAIWGEHHYKFVEFGLETMTEIANALTKRGVAARDAYLMAQRVFDTGVPDYYAKNWSACMEILRNTDRKQFDAIIKQGYRQLNPDSRMSIEDFRAYWLSAYHGDAICLKREAQLREVRPIDQDDLCPF